LINEHIDEVALFDFGEGEFEAFRNDDHLRADGMRGEAGHDERFTALSGDDGPIGIQFRARIVARKK
jgi:hypothetical protein